MRFVCRKVLFTASIFGMMLALICPAIGTARISVMMSQNSELYNLALESFSKAMGKSEATITTTYNLDENMDKGIKYARQIKEDGADLVLAMGTTAAMSAKSELKDIPIVFCMVLNPLASGLIDNMECPCGNITGASLDIPLEAQYDYMKLLLPDLKSIGVMYNPEETGITVKNAIEVAKRKNLSLIAKPVHTNKDVNKALKSLLDKVDLLWSVADGTVFVPQLTRHILLSTLRKKVPFMGLSHSFVKAGALFALSCDYADTARQAAEIADRILHGEQPGEIPVAMPRKISLSINLRTAEHINLSIPQKAIEQADALIK